MPPQLTTIVASKLETFLTIDLQCLPCSFGGVLVLSAIIFLTAAATTNFFLLLLVY